MGSALLTVAVTFALTTADARLLLQDDAAGETDEFIRSFIYLSASRPRWQDMRIIIQTDVQCPRAGTTLTGPHTEMKTYNVTGNGGACWCF